MNSTAKKIRRVLLPLAAGLCLAAAGCLNPAMFKKGAYAIDDWETWTGWNDAYGSHETAPDGLYYRLTARQDDARDLPSGGYLPGLMLSRDIAGQRWRIDLRADFKIPPGQMKRFSCGVWLGEESTRPSLASPAAALTLLAQRQNGPRPEDDAFTLTCRPGAPPVQIPRETAALRFERTGNFFEIFYSLDGKKFISALRLDASVMRAAAAQKFFIGGFAGGDPGGARARFTSLKLNNRELLR